MEFIRHASRRSSTSSTSTDEEVSLHSSMSFFSKSSENTTRGMMSVQKQWYKRNATETAIKTTGSNWKKEDGKYSEKTPQNSEMTGKKRKLQVYVQEQYDHEETKHEKYSGAFQRTIVLRPPDLTQLSKRLESKKPRRRGFRFR